MNVNFQYSKTLAIEGSILLLLGLIPTVGWVLGIIGIVLLLRATKELSYYYQDESINRNAWTGLKYYIIALIAAAVAISVGVISFATTGLMAGAPFSFAAGIVGGIVAIIVGLIIAFIFYVLAAVHLRKAYETLAQKTGEGSFNTAGTLLMLGAYLTLLFGVGLILIFVSWIFVIIGFSSMKPREYQPYPGQNGNGYPQPPPAPQPQSTPQNGQTAI
ncbi:MAG: DUF996 domain-containing protein [Candidatus Bathyarchaeota archaeon]|nr:DUF996 domain-containing protein [Candidatus Bathyarchaeota archaeon]